ncbi:MAG TPA: hypothetical protein VJT16_19595 [Streptosporangiaceae bacterium]|nr:hypothetical protein [Streptosporangiaceae bacterium]
MKGGTQTGIALAVGYALGRRHKLRMAAMLAIAASSGGLGALGSAALKRGASMGVGGGLLGKVTPEVGGIAGKIRGELINAGKAAAVAMVSNRVESISDSLHQRADTIRGPRKTSGDAEDEDVNAGERDDEPDDVDEPEDYYDEADDEDEFDDEDAADEEPATARRGGGRRSPVSRAGR